MTWGDIKWSQVEHRVFKVQERIYKAKLTGNRSKLHWLQKLLINSNDAKLFAVYQVTTLNKGKDTAGVDGKTITKGSEKLSLAQTLYLDGKASPIRRVWIPKPGRTEKRPLGIPTIKDRAKQALAKMALEPEWEAVFEPNSYGYRPGRRAQDAIEAIFLGLRHKKPKLLFDADVSKCFEDIEHNPLLDKLDTFPAMKTQISAWLKAGIMDGYANRNKEIYETDKGTPQGGIISPLLANIALHGLENHLKDFVTQFKSYNKNRGTRAKQKALSVIRYADDFLLIHHEREMLDACIEETKKWLATIGLKINPIKSAVRLGADGFNFLGFQVIQVRKAGVYKVKITPSKKKCKTFLLSIRKVIQDHKTASSYQLIAILRPKIIGWANYFKYCECKQTFHKLTHQIFLKLRAWVFRRDTRNGRLEIKERYFPSNKTYVFDGNTHRDNWILNGTGKTKQGIRTNYLPHIVWVVSQKHVKVKGAASPYDGNAAYWGLRQAKYAGLSLREKVLLKRQGGNCNICKEKITTFSTTEVDHIKPKSQGGKDHYNNLQLIHRYCHIPKTNKELKLLHKDASGDLVPESC